MSGGPGNASGLVGPWSWERSCQRLQGLVAPRLLEARWQPAAASDRLELRYPFQTTSELLQTGPMEMKTIDELS